MPGPGTVPLRLAGHSGVPAVPGTCNDRWFPDSATTPLPDTLLLLEHPHVYTRGRLSKPEHLLSTEMELAAAGVPVVDTDRGGQITYHGPGQLVAYPVIDLREWGGPLRYVRTLEQIVAATLADFSIEAHTEEGLTGVWTSDGKVAAIGIKVSRGVAFHGFSINVNTSLAHYDRDRPLRDRGPAGYIYGESCFMSG